MAPHTRSRTGCWTCREAGYKCDEQRPHCGRCIRLNITCKGYGVKLKWRNIPATSPPTKRARNGRGKSVESPVGDSPVSTSSISSAPAILGSMEANPSSEWTKGGVMISISTLDTTPDLSTGDKRLLHYWTERLSSLISVTPKNEQPSPFQQHLTYMVYLPGALRSTILSMAANHLSLVSNDSSLRLHAYRHQRDAIQLLQRLIASPAENNREPALATILMMQISTRLFGDDDAEPHATNHLIGAKAMVSQRGGLAAWNTTPSARFLLSVFAYHDILSSVSRGSSPLIEHGTRFNAIEGATNMHSIAEVLQLVARISELQHMTKSGTDDAGFPDRRHAISRDIEQALLDLNFLSLSNNDAEALDVILTAEAYRHAAFIYLYRVWLNVGSPNPTTIHHVERCLSCIDQISVNSSLVSSHIWPLFTAGCEAITFEQRIFVRVRFQEMFISRKFPALKRVANDIEEVWSSKDSSGHEAMSIDCISVIKKRGREVDLA